MALTWSVAKDPTARKDYGIDWSALFAVGETITAVVWTIPTGISSDGETHINGVTTIWIAGGTSGQKYTLKCRITTSRGLVDERSVVLSVKDQ